MRFNEDGINAIAEEIKDKWQYLRLADSTTNTYDSSSMEYDDPLQTIVLESVSVTDNIITAIYRLDVLSLDGENIDMSALATASAGNAVESNEEFVPFFKDDLTQWRWVYKIKLLR
jgi:phosphoribosylaminoimidazole carboxylase (NCAIR synthetase)